MFHLLRYICFMTTTQPEVQLYWTERLDVALKRGWPTYLEAARYLGVSRTTIYRWLKGEAPERAAYLRAVATGSGVPYEWLEPTAEEMAAGPTWYAPGDLNPEPTDCESMRLRCRPRAARNLCRPQVRPNGLRRCHTRAAMYAHGF